MKSIRDILEEETKKTEKEIKESLQKFHDITGMIPANVSFNIIDIKTCQPDEPRKVILVSSVYLKANT